jgi:hypothetical protein
VNVRQVLTGPPFRANLTSPILSARKAFLITLIVHMDRTAYVYSTRQNSSCIR